MTHTTTLAGIGSDPNPDLDPESDSDSLGCDIIADLIEAQAAMGKQKATSSRARIITGIV
ncbi:MAG: hypothetical protein AAGC55_17835 [Myxococcota bacterium]